MAAASESTQDRKREIYTYNAPWPVYSLAWSVRNDPECQYRLAIGSFVEDYTNKVSVIQLNEDGASEDFSVLSTFDHPYPPTKLMFVPDRDCTEADLLASTGDYLRMWEVTETGIHLKHLFNNNKRTEYCAPLTSFDWNAVDKSLVITSSIDTTCTLWDVEKQKAIVQLIAHDKEAFDVAFATRGKDVFGSVGADGSIRVFDKRKLDHSTIMYESPSLTPLLRLEWNKQDPNYLATVLLDSSVAVILDIRMPSVPIAQLRNHTGALNALAWAPHSSCHICTAGEDSQALIWDLQRLPARIEDPILAYSAPDCVNHLKWSDAHPDWVSIAFDSHVQLLRV